MSVVLETIWERHQRISKYEVPSLVRVCGDLSCIQVEKWEQHEAHSFFIEDRAMGKVDKRRATVMNSLYSTC